MSHRVPDEYRICITDIFVVDDVELEKYGWGTIKTDDKPVYYLMLSYTFENKMPETEVNKNYYQGTTETLSDAYVNRWRGSSGASGGRIQAGTIAKGHIHIEIDDDTVKSLKDVRSIIFQWNPYLIVKEGYSIKYSQYFEITGTEEGWIIESTRLGTKTYGNPD